MMWANVAIWRRIEGIMIAPRGANSNALELSIVAIHLGNWEKTEWWEKNAALVEEQENMHTIEINKSRDMQAN